MRQIPVAHELNNGEATGILHWFCSDNCRAEFLAASSPEVFGLDVEDGAEPMTVCEWCEKELTEPYESSVVMLLEAMQGPDTDATQARVEDLAEFVRRRVSAHVQREQ